METARLNGKQIILYKVLLPEHPVNRQGDRNNGSKMVDNMLNTTYYIVKEIYYDRN